MRKEKTLQSEQIAVNRQIIHYHIFGTGKIDLVIEMGLGAALGEWWHIAERLSERYTVLLYQRGRNTAVPRTPRNIAEECHALISELDHQDKIIILAHSQGGLYAQQFARLYPELVKGIILLDPLSANDSSFKAEFPTPKEQHMTGFDKSANLKILEKMARLHLGFVIKAFMQKAPPFYYYSGFSSEARNSILQELTQADLHHAALEEYRLAHEPTEIEALRTSESFPDIPIALITHGRDFEIKEIMEFGQNTEAFACRVEDFWQSLMQEYLSFSSQTLFLSAKRSGHFIHLTEPELMDEALSWIEGQA